MTDGSHAATHLSGSGDCCPRDAAKAHGSTHQCDEGCNDCGLGGCAVSLLSDATAALPLYRHIHNHLKARDQVGYHPGSLLRPPIALS